MKTKPKPNTKDQTLSRASQKTFIITAAIAYLVQSVMMSQFIISIFSMEFPSIGSYLLYPLAAVGVPLFAFLITYFIASNGPTKLWRVCQAAIIAFLSIMVDGFLVAVNTVVFNKQFGYVDQPEVSYAFYLQLIPHIVTLGLVALASIWLRRRKASLRSATSRISQTTFIGLLVFASVGQMFVTYFGVTSGNIGGAAMDAGALMGMLTSLIIPVIVWAILFLLMSRKKTTLERVFTSLIYVVIAALIFMASMAAAFSLSSLGVPPQGGPTNSIADTIAPFVALAAFAGVVGWHKWKQLI